MTETSEQINSSILQPIQNLLPGPSSVALRLTRVVILLQDTILKDHEILFQAILKTSTGELVILFPVNLRTMNTEESPILFMLRILTFVVSPILATL